MATVSVASVISRVSTLLQDTTNVRWPQAELAMYISDAQREVALFKPDACIKVSSVKLDSGTRQAIPSDGVALIEVTRNMGTNGSTPGNAIRVCSREILDAQYPGWHSSAQTVAPVHYTFAPNNQKGFFVYPPNTGAGYVEVVYNASPSDVSATGTLQIDDVWMPSIINYTMHRAYSKDAEYAANAQLAQAYYQAFVASLTGRTNAEQAISPNRSIQNPNAPK